MKFGLSKSQYCMAVQCPKMLWLKKHKPESFDPLAVNQAVLDTGIEVGELARGIFGPFALVEYGDFDRMLSDTQALMVSGEENIAEATFSDHGLFCRVDILKNFGDHVLEIYEVKSSTSISEINLHDVAFQYYVLTNLGYHVKKVCLVHIDNTYVRQGELDIQALFKINDVTEEAKCLYSEVQERIEYLKEYLFQKEEPQQDLGLHCFSPYACACFGYCGNDLPKPNVFDLSGVLNKTKVKYYQDGKISFNELEDCPKLNAGAMKQVKHHLYDLPEEINREAIANFMVTLSYPLYFLDFESIQPAIPMFDNSKPYEQIVFQYSLHYIEEEGGELKHKEYLAYPGKDPRRKLAEQLCSDIPMNVCTTAYNMGFEKGRIKGLASLYPDLSEHLMNIHDHIVDLMVPFRQKHYYNRAMEGSYSIKYVLPALFPDVPELDYHNLEGVHNGTEASATFLKMADMNDEEQNQYREYLLKYCGLDTNAMVKVWKKLLEVISNS